ncbi:MAG: hypothetical protein Q9175_004440, partial [Cornicularia normoerica]
PCSLFDTRVKFDEELGEATDDLVIANAQSDTKNELNDMDIDTGNDPKRKRVSDPVMIVDPDCIVDSDSSTACENNGDSDSSSVYLPDDDDYGAGPEKTRAFLYRHFTIAIVPNETPGKPNMVFMKATLLYTKGEYNNPRIKTLVIDGEDNDLIFSLLDYLISLTVNDDVFEAESAKDVQNIFWVKMPQGKKSLTLKWKRRVLNRPVFREPLRGVGEAGTSPIEPLRASTWIRYLKRLGEKAGFQHAFTQYGLRRSLLNIVNHKAPASVRDQIFNHRPGTVSWYLDEEVQFDTKACYLGRPSNDVVQKVARLTSLTADASAPTELSSEQSAKLSQHLSMIRLCQKNKALTTQIHAAGYRPISTAKGTRLFEKKKKSRIPLELFQNPIAKRHNRESPETTLQESRYRCLRLSICRRRSPSGILTRRTLRKADRISSYRASGSGSLDVCAH